MHVRTKRNELQYYFDGFEQHTWGLLCQKQVWRVGANNYIPQYLWGVTVCPCPLYLLLGAVSIRKTVLQGMVIPMLKIRRPNGRLIFNMEIAIRR